MYRMIFLFLSVLGTCMWAQAETHFLSVGQGISMPSITTGLILSNGFTAENPVGVAYQTGVRLTLEHDMADDSVGGFDGTGGELGVGNGRMGIAAGYRQLDCNNCEGDTYGGLGIMFSNFLGFGISATEEIYSAGIILNPRGSHRLGFNATLNDVPGDDNNITAFGVGYSFVSHEFSITVDASKLDYENPGLNDDLILITPGLMIEMDFVQASISLNTYANDDTNTLEDEAWWGVGIGRGKPFHLAVYNDFVNEWALALSMFF